MNARPSKPAHGLRDHDPSDRFKARVRRAAPILLGILIWALAFASIYRESVTALFLQSAPTKSPEASFEAVLNQIVPRLLNQYGVPGVVISTVVHGDPSQVYAFGYADVAGRKPMTRDTVFQAASLSKSVTSWGVMKMVQDGRLELDVPVDGYLAPWPLPSSPFSADGVTLRRLLNHTSGINAGGDVYRRPGERTASAAELLNGTVRGSGSQASRARLVAPAGSVFTYSANGYSLVQMILEQRSGQTFRDYMRDNILQPLLMTSSSFDWDSDLRERTATPYREDGSALRVRPPQDAAADGLFTTGGDMARFIAAPIPGLLLPVGAGVLNSNTVIHLFEPALPSRRNPIAYVGHDVPSQGFFLEKSRGGPLVVTNGGYDPGWSTQFFVVPATGDGIVILTNSSRGLPFIAQIAGLWADWRGLPKPQITDAYQTLGAQAILIVSILTIASVPAGVSLLVGIQSGKRRFGAFDRAAVVLSLLEILLSAALIGVYVLIRQGFEALPTFALVAEAAISFMTTIVIARLLFPEARKPPSGG